MRLATCALVVLGVAAVGCGGDSSSGDADLCQKVKDKVTECDGTPQCPAGSDEASCPN
jgi:hypothetical protein